MSYTTPDLEYQISLKIRVDALNADYIHAIDDDRLEEWPTFFTSDGEYSISTRENYDLDLPICLIQCKGTGMFRDRISALRQANIFEPHTYCHTISALQITGASDGILKTKANFSIIRTMSEGEMMIFAAGRYLDKIVETDGKLLFSERRVILESRRIDTLLVIPI
jgi:anthranilate 1,2-dioxygenase small subunit